MGDLAELIERVEKATGPDRELDFDVAVFAGELPAEAAKYGPYLRRITQRYVEPYSSAVDPVLALILRRLPGWEVNFTATDGVALDVYLIGPKYRDDRPGEESSPPVGGKPVALALLLAFLKATQHQEKK